MQVKEIISALDAEIARLQQVRAMLSGGETGNGRSARTVKSSAAKRTMSAEGRARIAAAQKARWAAAKKAAK